MIRKRPTSITIIAWYFIIIYALALTSIPMVLSMPVARETMEATGTPIGLSLGFLFLSSLIMIVSGILILKAQKIGKYISIAYMPVSIILTSIINGFQASLITGIIIYAVILYFLTRKDAHSYFDHEWVAPAMVAPEMIPVEKIEPVSRAAASDVLVYERVTKGEDSIRIIKVDPNEGPIKGTSMARKVTGAVFFFLGDGMLLNYFALILPILVKLSDVTSGLVGTVVSGIMLFITGVLILIGFLIWGFRNWRDLMTIGTLITGAWTVLGALGFISIRFSPQYSQMPEFPPNMDFDFLTMGIYMLIAGLVNLIIAACFSAKFKRFVSERVMNRK